MKSYKDLVSGISAIHSFDSKSGVPQEAIEGDWLPCAVDNSTSNLSGEIPVVVSVGANYADGIDKAPTQDASSSRTEPPWIEENLAQWKNNSSQHIFACAEQRVKPHWNGCLPWGRDPESLAKDCAEKISGDFHFAMANFCPWITREPWSKLRDVSVETSLELISRSGHREGLISYFRGLRQAVGRDAIWIGHGNAEIYGLFRLVCWTLDIEKWFFASNLARPNQMIAR